MGKLIAGGDSYVWGSELPDCDQYTPSAVSWPALLAKHLKLDYNCAALYGGSNSAIARHTMNSCEKNKHQQLFVVVQWTFCNRYEFRMRYDTGQNNSPWYSISDWTIKQNANDIEKSFDSNNENILNYHINYIKQAQKIGIADFATVFYDHVGNSEYYEIYTSLKEILFLQNYLDLNKIPYLFTAANSDFFNPDTFTIKNADETISTLMLQINWNSWFMFPSKDHSVGFYRWAKENNFSIGTTHPLHNAHYAAFNLIKRKVEQLWVS